MSQDLTAGWTGPIDEQLLADGQPYDLSTMTVELILKTKAGTQVSTTSTAGPEVSILTSTSGVVRYLPTSADLKAEHSPYAARWKVTDSTGRVVFFPSGRPSVWTVYEP